MKTVFKKLSALSLAFVLCISATACLENASNNTPSFEDELCFNRLRAALVATQTHDGDLTVSTEQKQTVSSATTQTSAPVSTSTQSKRVFSRYAEPYVYYYTQTDSVVAPNGKTTDNTRTQKGFMQSGGYYSYTKEDYPSMNYTQETYTKLLPRNAKKGFEGFNLSSALSTLAGNTFAPLNDYESLKSAYETVYAAVEAKTIAELSKEEEPFNKEEGDDLSVNATLSLTNEENGEDSLSIKSTLSVKNVDEDGSQENIHCEITRSFTAIDGKLHTVSLTTDVKTSETTPAKNGETPETTEYQTASSTTYTFDYSFDRAGYDKIITLLSSANNVNEEREDYANDIRVFFDNVSMKCTPSSTLHQPTVSDALENLTLSIESNFIDSSYLVKINGLYTDKELQNPINMSMSDADYFNLDTLYAKYTIADGHYALQTSSESVYNLSEPYQAVLTHLSLFDADDYPAQFYVYPCENQMDCTEGVNEEAEMFVNGAKVTETPVFESGKTYSVVFKYYYTDEDVDLLDLFFFASIN
nr:hypothetical protein [Clostridia bacterium]